MLLINRTDYGTRYLEGSEIGTISHCILSLLRRKAILNTPLHVAKVIRLGNVSFLAENDSEFIQLSVSSLLLYPSPLPSSVDDFPSPKFSLSTGNFSFHFQLISSMFIFLTYLSIPLLHIYTTELVYWCIWTLSLHVI